MTNVISFRPREGLDAEIQVRDFIKWTKGIKGFDKPDLPLDWNSWSWRIWMGVSLDFVKLGVSSRKKSFDPSKDLIDPLLMDFAKAYVLQQQSLNITKNIQEIVAVRVVEAALLELGTTADITQVNLHIYDRASELIKENYTGATAYRIGGYLQKLSEFIVEKGMSERGDTWVNLIKRPSDAHGHVKNKIDAQKKMPTKEALDALAEIWSAQPTDHRDIFVSSNCALLLSSPGRVGELNILAADSLSYKDNSEGKPELFINWYGQKGYGFTDKPVPAIWKDFTIESVRRLKNITEEPRELAKWLEENPNDFPIHQNCPQVSQDTLLTPEQVLDAMCLYKGHSRSRLRTWLSRLLETLGKKPLWVNSKKVLQEQLDNMYEGAWVEGNCDTYTLTLRKLNIILREYMLPPHFPYTDDGKKTKYQNALNCYFVGQFNADGRGFLKPFSLQKIDSNMLNSSLSITEATAERYNNKNIFLRWGYKGEAYSMTTHQFRHYLNTLAAKGLVGEVEIARWSGRLDISQNRVYNHISDEEHVKSARGLGIGEQSTALATLSSKHQPILLKDLGVGEDRIAHYTEYGVCVHDFTVEPCTKFRECLSCRKHKCIKGDIEKERRIRLLRDGLKLTLKQATVGIKEEFYGADRWLTDTMDRLEKANALVEIFENPDIPEGAVIECSDNGYSPLEKVLAANGKLPASDALSIGSAIAKPQADLDKLTRLLGR